MSDRGSVERSTEQWEPTPEGLAAARRQLGRNLREKRIERKLSQEQAAKIAGVSRPTYAKFETGDAIIGWDPLRALAQHYGCKPSALMPPGRTYPEASLDPVERREYFRARNRGIRESDLVPGQLAGTYRRRDT